MLAFLDFSSFDMQSAVIGFLAGAAVIGLFNALTMSGRRYSKHRYR